MQKSVIKNAILNAGATGLYVAAVASFLYYVPKQLGPANTALAPIALLLLFVFSAAFTALLMIGRPVLWYVEGKKKEAVSLLALTLAFFFVIMLIAFLALFFSLGGK